MKKSWIAINVLAAMTMAACEDGPPQIYRPLDTDPPLRGGEGWTEPGGRGFDGYTGGDSAGRARFCDEAESTALIADIVNEPIVPDVSVGGMPLWSPDGQPLHADALLGRRADGKFCDPTETYSDAFVWGPTNEIIVFFNQETRLVEAIMAYQSYLGSMRGNVRIGDTTQEVVIQPRQRVTIGGVELDEYTSRAEAASRPRAWLNRGNVTRIYGMIRQTFFNDGPLPADYDCIAEQRCDVIYTANDESVPQDTFIDIADSGVQLRLTPDGYVTFVYLTPVRKADFELAGELDMGATDAVAPHYRSQTVDACDIDLEGSMSWAEFRQRCVTADRTLSRAGYDVYSQRDAVSVAFDGMTLAFLRAEGGAPYRDGERPADTDRLFSVGFTRSLAATVPQFVPRTLAQGYAARLSAHLAASVAPGASEEHPFRNFTIPVPDSLSDQPQRIGELRYARPNGAQASWIPDVLAGVHAAYEALSDADRAAVNAARLSDVALIEPFVATVMSAFSFERTDAPTAFRGFRTTDDERWVIAFASFIQNEQPYRLVVQYSLNFGAVTAITVEHGGSAVDETFAAVNEGVWTALGQPAPAYYDIRIAAETVTINPFSLGSAGIEVGAADRLLGTVDVTLVLGEGEDSRTPLTVPGTPIEDRAGFQRQLRGERWEFVPAHEVFLLGKETSQVFHVLADGTIGRVEQRLFKSRPRLCGGPVSLRIGYGDDVRASIQAWRAMVGDDVYRTCELVFNYSDDGHVLNSVASLTNRTQFTTVAGRATTVAIWR